MMGPGAMPLVATQNLPAAPPFPLVPKLRLGNTLVGKLQLPFPDEMLTRATPLQNP